MHLEQIPPPICERLHLFACVQGSNYKEGLTPVLSLLTEGSRCHREIRRYIKAQVSWGDHQGRHVLGHFYPERELRHEKTSLKEAEVHQSNSLHLQVLPPLTEVKIRPEVGSTLRNKLVRLMTHVDMGVKQTAAEFLFVLCKESGERVTVPWVWHVGLAASPVVLIVAF